jgi:hypothetical protein
MERAAKRIELVVRMFHLMEVFMKRIFCVGFILAVTASLSAMDDFKRLFTVAQNAEELPVSVREELENFDPQKAWNELDLVDAISQSNMPGVRDALRARMPLGDLTWKAIDCHVSQLKDMGFALDVFKEIEYRDQSMRPQILARYPQFRTLL